MWRSVERAVAYIKCKVLSRHWNVRVASLEAKKAYEINTQLIPHCLLFRSASAFRNERWLDRAHQLIWQEILLQLQDGGFPMGEAKRMAREVGWCNHGVSVSFQCKHLTHSPPPNPLNPFVCFFYNREQKQKETTKTTVVNSFPKDRDYRREAMQASTASGFTASSKYDSMILCFFPYAVSLCFALYLWCHFFSLICAFTWHVFSSDVVRIGIICCRLNCKQNKQKLKMGYSCGYYKAALDFLNVNFRFDFGCLLSKSRSLVPGIHGEKTLVLNVQPGSE